MSKEKVYSEIIMVKTTEVTPNKYNPNIMGDEIFESLMEDFKENGWIGQPVIVAENKNGKFEIIDGYHRWRAATLLNFKKIPIIVFNPKDEDHQKIVTIALNSKRGEMNSLKLAKLITELNNKYTLEELSSKLGFGVADLKDKLSLTQVTEEFMEKIRKDSVEREKEIPVIINFAVSKQQGEFISGVLEKIEGKNKGEKLYLLCDLYLKQK
ncbi:MAG: ParB-like protein partition protein [Candidatus Moranbacteria bacterium GW2011_GWE1_35_17]|nr:MAG: ParB-like protein partition protein [Candidatus Moranbacteria bacterium GW2011_GWE1_35_17]KKP83877.1 MAG: ParB-like protein partition protein [Candidatus Moranbacteria bacterium GW2011_GWF1_35_5]KKP83939.1 MAG: ParB-like protein partition protein [Candidatus Moranbacteria bacterium GW2011_GWF2_35_54]